jgi:hypothetical protein
VKGNISACHLREFFKLFKYSLQIALKAALSSSFVLNTGPDIAPIVLDPLNFSNKSLVFFALNNNPDVSQAAGGSHWSLCLYTRSDNTLRHYDSCKGMNSHVANALCAALAPSAPPKLKLIEADEDGFRCPQQENNYDCGLMVLAIAEILCERFIVTGGLDDFKIDAKEVGARELDIKRWEIHSLIINKVS